VNRVSRRCHSLARTYRGSQAGKPRWCAATRGFTQTIGDAFAATVQRLLHARLSRRKNPHSIAPAATAHEERLSNLTAQWQTRLHSQRLHYIGPANHKFSRRRLLAPRICTGVPSTGTIDS
jgi:hypothetical protein